MRIFITGPDGQIKAEAAGTERAVLVYDGLYEEGDVLHMTGEPGFVVAQLEDSMAETYGYLSGEFRLEIPFGEKKISYSPKAFTGDRHLLWVRRAAEEEIQARRNLARNVLDSHDNQGFFPHASANVETRGESVFAARNAIDGCCANDCHGRWPYQSWGINRDPDAALRLDFGRTVRLDRLVFTLRADFPHDSWWNRCTVRFSDGSELEPAFVKTGERQSIDFTPRTVEWLIVEKLIKDPEDPSPFPALTQLEAWGTEVQSH